MLATGKSQDKFLKLLRNDILKLDLADLDFGVYRIFKYRRKEVEDFLTKRLPEKIEASLKGQSQDRNDELQARLDDLTKELETLAKSAFGLSGAFDGDTLRDQLAQTVPGKEYLEKSEMLARSKAEQGMGENEQERLYNTLYTFFSRYYEDGDFLAQPRRGKEARFSVPYRGEDVHFSWRGRGSHYVKTSEQLRSYAFTADSTDVRFEFVSADVEKDNVKGDKRYLIPLSDPDVTKKQVTLYFEHRPLTAQEEKQHAKGEIQDALIKEKLGDILGQLTDVRISEGDLFTHIRRYARKHTSDYFVHPDLGAFLHSEFDYYLKNEYLNPDAFTNPEAMTETFIKFRALRDIGGEIITFLDQIESFQARLFEKRRFVLGCSYLVQTRHLTDEQKNQALENEAQVQAWRDLFAIEDTIDKSFVDAHPTLVVDTKHFDKDFELSVLARFDDLDEATDGLLIHAENYGALRTLQPKFEGKVNAFYTDPPYNTNASEILYKNNYKHSTWLTFIQERMFAARQLLTSDAVACITIDDYEFHGLKLTLDDTYGVENHLGTVLIRNNPSGRSTKNGFAINHEYALFYSKSDALKQIGRLPHTDEQLQRYDNKDEQRGFEWENMRKSSAESNRADRPKQFYPIIYNPDKESVRLLEMEWNEEAGEWTLLEDKADNEVAIYPLNTSGVSKVWQWGVERTSSSIDDVKVRQVKGRYEVYKKKYVNEEGTLPRTWWDKPSYSARDSGTAAITNMFGDKQLFDFPKAVEAVKDCLRVARAEADTTTLDIFGGSGTTAQAVVELNREDGERRKFIILEMGDHFDNVLQQRFQKAVFYPEWRNKSPKEDPTFPMNGVYPEWVERSPRLVKVMRLESYEDSLNALELPQEQSARAKGMQDLFGDEYLLKYLLPTELEEPVGFEKRDKYKDMTAVFLNTKLLETPFGYHLRNYTAEGAENQLVDLVETFNLLMGYHVKRIFKLPSERKYICVEAQTDVGKVLVVWRDIAGLDPEAERAFLEEQLDLDVYSSIYANADIAVPKGQSLDREFKDRLLARAVGVLA